jgi:hypothetical protein
MSTVTDVGGSELIEAQGRMWTLSHVGPGIRSAFASWVKLRARQEIIALKADLGPLEYREQLAILGEELGGDSYAWGTPLDPKSLGLAVCKKLQSHEGQVRLLQLLLAKAHGDVPVSQVVSLLESAPEEVNLALHACLDLPPNSQAPAREQEVSALSSAEPGMNASQTKTTEPTGTTTA